MSRSSVKTSNNASSKYDVDTRKDEFGNEDDGSEESTTSKATPFAGMPKLNDTGLDEFKKFIGFGCHVEDATRYAWLNQALADSRIEVVDYCPSTRSTNPAYVRGDGEDKEVRNTSGFAEATRVATREGDPKTFGLTVVDNGQDDDDDDDWGTRKEGGNIGTPSLKLAFFDEDDNGMFIKFAIDEAEAKSLAKLDKKYKESANKKERVRGFLGLRHDPVEVEKETKPAAAASTRRSSKEPASTTKTTAATKIEESDLGSLLMALSKALDAVGVKRTLKALNALIDD